MRDFKNSMKLTTLEHLQQAANFSKIQTVYQQALIEPTPLALTNTLTIESDIISPKISE